MSEKLPSFDEAIALLKTAVKYSNIDDQKHLDLSLVDANERYLYQQALMVTQTSVIKGEYTQAQINELIGLI